MRISRRWEQNRSSIWNADQFIELRLNLPCRRIFIQLIDWNQLSIICLRFVKSLLGPGGAILAENSTRLNVLRIVALRSLFYKSLTAETKFSFYLQIYANTYPSLLDFHYERNIFYVFKNWELSHYTLIDW